MLGLHCLRHLPADYIPLQLYVRLGTTGGPRWPTLANSPPRTELEESLNMVCVGPASSRLHRATFDMHNRSWHHAEVSVHCAVESVKHRVVRFQKAMGRGWRWNSAAQSFHPPGVTYDPEVSAASVTARSHRHWALQAQVLFKNVDHFCPWTGTVIADNNLFYFHW